MEEDNEKRGVAGPLNGEKGFGANNIHSGRSTEGNNRLKTIVNYSSVSGGSSGGEEGGRARNGPYARGTWLSAVFGNHSAGLGHFTYMEKIQKSPQGGGKWGDAIT